MEELNLTTGFSHSTSEKKQIVVGCTGSPLSAEEWAKAQKRKLPHYVIDRDGKVYSLFDDSYGSTAIAVDKDLRHMQTRNVNAMAVTVFLANAGACCLGQYKYVYEYCSCSPYRGCRYYEMYTTAQLKALRNLLETLIVKHGIRYRYSNRLGDICKDAMQGNEGVFLMTAFSRKTNNPHPQYDLIKMLKELAQWAKLL